MNRRIKIAYIDDAALLGVFTAKPLPGPSIKDEYFRYHCLHILNVPLGTTVNNVSWNYSRQCFMLILTHESFDEIPLGEELPIMDVQLREAITDQYGNICYTRFNPGDGTTNESSNYRTNPLF